MSLYYKKTGTDDVRDLTESKYDSKEKTLKYMLLILNLLVNEDV